MKYLLAFLLSLLFCAAPSAALEQETYSMPIDFQALSAQASPSVTLFRLPDEGTFDPDAANYGHQLRSDPVAALAYQALTQQLEPGVSLVSFDLGELINLEWDTQIAPGLQAAVAAYIFDHPESQYCTIPRISLQGTVASFIVEQRADSVRRKAALDKAIDRFLEDFDDSASPAEQCRAIHDYICTSTSYDHAAAEAGVFSEAHTAFGVLVDGRDVVCEGYSKSFKVLCDAVGLPCILVAGSSFNPGDSDVEKINHMWNYVRIDDAWYAVDVTWDDYYDDYLLTPDLDLTVSFLTYTYFLNNDYFIADTDRWDHNPTGNIHYAADWPMTFGLPQLTPGQHPEAVGLIPDNLVVTVYSDFLSIPERLWAFGLDEFSLGSISNVTVELTRDSALDATLTVPAEKTYIIDSTGTQTYSIRHAAGFEAPLFAVEGGLVLEDVEIGDQSVILPLLTLGSNGSFQDAADPELDSYLNYSGEETGPAIGYQASYDTNGRMLELTQMGTFRLTTPAIYSFGIRPNVPKAAETVKQFLIGPATMAPVSRCITKP